MEVHTLYEGTYSVDITKKFIPFDPGVHSYQDRPASLFINVQPFLVSMNNKLILLDTGLGFKNAQDELVLHQHIRNAGFEPDDISMVLMSHLHYDHAGGMVIQSETDIQLSFPNATYVIQRGEWEQAYIKPGSSYKLEIFDYLQRNADILFIEGSGTLEAGISYELTGAHTAFHQVFLLEDGGEKVFFGGDVLPEPEELVKNFVAKYDLDGRLAMEQRKAFGKRAAAEDWTCLFYHGKSAATGKVVEEAGGFKVI